MKLPVSPANYTQEGLEDGVIQPEPKKRCFGGFTRHWQGIVALTTIEMADMVTDGVYTGVYFSQFDLESGQFVQGLWPALILIGAVLLGVRRHERLSQHFLQFSVAFAMLGSFFLSLGFTFFFASASRTLLNVSDLLDNRALVFSLVMVLVFFTVCFIKIAVLIAREKNFFFSLICVSVIFFFSVIFVTEAGPCCLLYMPIFGVGSVLTFCTFISLCGSFVTLKIRKGQYDALLERYVVVQNREAVIFSHANLATRSLYEEKKHFVHEKNNYIIDIILLVSEDVFMFVIMTVSGHRPWAWFGSRSPGHGLFEIFMNVKYFFTIIMILKRFISVAKFLEVDQDLNNVNTKLRKMLSFQGLRSASIFVRVSQDIENEATMRLDVAVHQLNLLGKLKEFVGAKRATSGTDYPHFSTSIRSWYCEMLEEVKKRIQEMKRGDTEIESFSPLNHVGVQNEIRSLLAKMDIFGLILPLESILLSFYLIVTIMWLHHKKGVYMGIVGHERIVSQLKMFVGQISEVLDIVYSLGTSRPDPRRRQSQRVRNTYPFDPVTQEGKNEILSMAQMLKQSELTKFFNTGNIRNEMKVFRKMKGRTKKLKTSSLSDSTKILSHFLAAGETLENLKVVARDIFNSKNYSAEALEKVSNHMYSYLQVAEVEIKTMLEIVLGYVATCESFFNHDFGTDLHRTLARKYLCSSALCLRNFQNKNGDQLFAPAGDWSKFPVLEEIIVLNEGNIEHEVRMRNALELMNMDVE